MQIDMHYGAIYCLAVLAGIDDNDARIGLFRRRCGEISRSRQLARDPDNTKGKNWDHRRH